MTPISSDSSMRVLIVEDERRLCDLLRSALPDMGFAATGAGSGEEALRILETSTHEIVLLDLRLPGMSGLDFFKTLQQRWPATAVIILTGYGDLEAARRAIHFGVVEFLTKPASLGDIEQALESARLSHLLRTRPVAPAVEAKAPVQPPPLGEPPDSPKSLEDLERVHILAALDRNKGNRPATAAELGISLRTLYYRLARYEQQRRV